MKETYILYRTLESFIRLRGEPVVKKTVDSVSRAAEFTGFGRSEEFLEDLEEKRSSIKKLFEKYLG